MSATTTALVDVPAQTRRTDDDMRPLYIRRGRSKAGQPMSTEDVRLVDGVAVVSEAPVQSNLPTKVPIRVTLLTLENDAQVYGCADCEATGPTRGVMMKHRAELHGAGSFGNSTTNRVRTVERRSKGNVNGSVNGNDDYIRVPKSAGSLSFAEIAEMASQAEHWSKVVRGLNDTIDDLRRRCASVTSKLKHAERRLTEVTDWKNRAQRAEGQIALIENAIEKLGYCKEGKE